MEKEFRDLIIRQKEMAVDWKSKGGKVIGHFCNYVPEEILHAAGILSIRILGSPDQITYADAHLQSYVCKLIRSSFDMGLKGELDYLDGMVIPYTCDPMRLLYDLWKKNLGGKFLHLLDIPCLIRGDLGQARFHREIIQFKRSLEEYIGRAISNEALSNSIRVYNENRSFLKEIYNIRRKESGMMSSSQTFEAVLSSMISPKELHSNLLKDFIKEAHRKIAAQKKATEPSKVRLHVSGSLITDMKFYEIIQEYGGAVISDDLCTGTRYYWDNVEEDNEPIKAISDRYYNKLPCPCKYPNTDRHEFILNSIRRGDIQGFLFIIERYCDAHLYDQPLLHEKLENMNVPVLRIDSELGLSGQEQLRTRIQTFIDILKRK
jgi:bcr-type benzoyl-CoA reductase subunit C